MCKTGRHHLTIPLSESSRSEANTVALMALAWILQDDDRAQRLLSLTGLEPDHLRHALDDPSVLASVLDFLLMDDAWITGFCDTAGQPYDAVMRARAALPGGQQMHWT